MVRINNIILSGLAAVGAVAQKCMTNDEAAFVAANYGTLIANYTTALADKTLAVNFTDYAESVNSLINSCPQGSAAVTLPLLAPTFSSREQFEIGQGQQPAINFEQLNMWVSCNAVVIRWTTTNTAPIPNPKPVVGLIAMEVVPNPDATAAETYPWLIDTVYSEFDAAAWLQNLMDAGICATSSTATSSVVAPTATSSVGVGGIAESKATVTVTATVTAAGVCSTGYVPKPSGYAHSSGYASPSGTGASGSWSAPTPTGSPIAPYKGAANAVNAAGLLAGAGAVAALFL